MFYCTPCQRPFEDSQQTDPLRRLKIVISRAVATQLVERIALIALACGSILVLLPAVLHAVATD